MEFTIHWLLLINVCDITCHVLFEGNSTTLLWQFHVSQHTNNKNTNSNKLYFIKYKITSEKEILSFYLFESYGK